MGLTLTTAPAEEPISTAEAKLFLRVDSTAEDTLIAQFITMARQLAEDYTGRAFVNQTWTLWLDRFPLAHREPWWDGVRTAHSNILNGGKRELIIPRSPLVSITYLKTYDDSNTATTFDAGSYIVDTTSSPGRIILENAELWPTDLRSANAVEIKFQAGYGAAADVPAAIKTALYLLIGAVYECRGALEKIPAPVKKLLDPYKVIYIDTDSEVLKPNVLL